jgi:hypothetical protein
LGAGLLKKIYIIIFMVAISFDACAIDWSGLANKAGQFLGSAAGAAAQGAFGGGGYGGGYPGYPPYAGGGFNAGAYANWGDNALNSPDMPGSQSAYPGGSGSLAGSLAGEMAGRFFFGGGPGGYGGGPGGYGGGPGGYGGGPGGYGGGPGGYGGGPGPGGPGW